MNLRPHPRMRRARNAGACAAHRAPFGGPAAVNSGILLPGRSPVRGTPKACSGKSTARRPHGELPATPRASRPLWTAVARHRFGWARLRARRGGTARGFTLVELLVSIGLTALLLWGILQLYTSATRFSAAMFSEAELCAGGRAILDRLCHELTSAATLDVGYLKITNTGGFATIQFVAPVGEGNALSHVLYKVDTGEHVGYLSRGTMAPVSNNQIPEQSAFEEEGEGKQYHPLGVKVDSFKIEYIDHGSSTGEPVSTTKTWQDADATDGTIDPMPRAVLVEIAVSDPKGRASIVLSSGAFLSASGQ